jgi:hypothetical protein
MLYLLGYRWNEAEVGGMSFNGFSLTFGNRFDDYKTKDTIQIMNNVYEILQETNKINNKIKLTRELSRMSRKD